MTDREKSRVAFRESLFVRRGMSVDTARQWATRLLERDRDGDDRRLCAECCHVRADWSCREGGTVVVGVLQRCHLFGWQTPSTKDAK